MSDSATLWTIALQAPLSTALSREEYWLPGPPPGNLPDPGTEPKVLTSPALASRFFTTSATWEANLGTLIDVQKGFIEFNYVDNQVSRQLH